MKVQKTLYNSWMTDFRKILFCVTVITLGTLYNIRQPDALAIAVIVQGISNIDGFWDFLNRKHLRGLLRIACAFVIALSLVASLDAVISLAGPNNFFVLGKNKSGWLHTGFVLTAVASPIILLFTDMAMNYKYENKSPNNDSGGGEYDEG